MKFLISDLLLFLCRDTWSPAEIRVPTCPKLELTRGTETGAEIGGTSGTGTTIRGTVRTCLSRGTRVPGEIRGVGQSLLDVVFMIILISPLLPSSQKHLSS